MRLTMHDFSGRVIGWIHDEGCENTKCKQAEAAGRPVHVTPAGFAVTMSDYHFVDEFEAGLNLGMAMAAHNRSNCMAPDMCVACRGVVS